MQSPRTMEKHSVPGILILKESVAYTNSVHLPPRLSILAVVALHHLNVQWFYDIWNEFVRIRFDGLPGSVVVYSMCACFRRLFRQPHRVLVEGRDTEERRNRSERTTSTVQYQRLPGFEENSKYSQPVGWMNLISIWWKTLHYVTWSHETNFQVVVLLGCMLWTDPSGVFEHCVEINGWIQIRLNT